MQVLVIALLLAILIVEYLVEEHGLLHPYVVLLPNFLSGIAMLVVLVRVMTGTRLELDWRYGLFLAVLIFTMTFGYAVGDTPSGAMLAGARAYLACIPFLLLPAVHRFTARQLHVQLLLLFAIALAETPLAFYQRFVEYAHVISGDPVRGTLTTSSNLSLFMIAVIGGAIVAHLRGRLGFLWTFAIAAWLFSATTINETKATLLLLPAAVLVPAMLMRGNKAAAKKLVPILAVGVLGSAAFIVTYNYFIQSREYAGPISSYLTGDTLRYYLYTGAANSDQEYIGRFDSIEIAIDHIARDPYTFLFGYGAGNVSESFLPQFAGRYWSYYLRFGVDQTQITQLLWELGTVGLLAYLFLYWLVTRDALALARAKDPATADLGMLWVIAMVIMAFGLIYKSLLHMTDFGYLFFYFSGVVASRAAALRRAAASAAAKRPTGDWWPAADAPTPATSALGSHR